MFQNESVEDTARALIIISPLFAPEPDEMRSIIRYAASGNQVFISSFDIEDTVMAMLHQKRRTSLFLFQDSSEVSILNPNRNQWERFSYPGYSFDNYFDIIDSGYTTVLGRNSKVGRILYGLRTDMVDPSSSI